MIHNLWICQSESGDDGFCRIFTDYNGFRGGLELELELELERELILELELELAHK